MARALVVGGELVSQRIEDRRERLVGRRRKHDVAGHARTSSLTARARNRLSRWRGDRFAHANHRGRAVRVRGFPGVAPSHVRGAETPSPVVALAVGDEPRARRFVQQAGARKGLFQAREEQTDAYLGLLRAHRRRERLNHAEASRGDVHGARAKKLVNAVRGGDRDGLGGPRRANRLRGARKIVIDVRDERLDGHLVSERAHPFEALFRHARKVGERGAPESQRIGDEMRVRVVRGREQVIVLNQRIDGLDARGVVGRAPRSAPVVRRRREWLHARRAKLPKPRPWRFHAAILLDGGNAEDGHAARASVGIVSRLSPARRFSRRACFALSASR